MSTTSNIQRLVAAELASALTSHEWTEAIPSISAAYRRVPDYQLEDLGSLKVSVIPGPINVNQDQQGPRGADFFGLSIGIVVAKHVASEQEIQDLEDLNQAIVDAVRSDLIELQGLPSGSDWMDITIPVPFDREALTERNVFMSQIEITYMVPLGKLASQATF